MKPKIENLIQNTHVKGFVYHGHIFVELIEGQSKEGRLPSDPAAHALWNFFCVASTAHRRMKENIVYEGDPSHTFNAPAVFRGIATAYAVDPNAMQRFWPIIQRQRMALKLTGEDDFPPEWKVVGSNH